MKKSQVKPMQYFTLTYLSTSLFGILIEEQKVKEWRTFKELQKPSAFSVHIIQNSDRNSESICFVPLRSKLINAGAAVSNYAPTWTALLKK